MKKKILSIIFCAILACTSVGTIFAMDLSTSVGTTAETATIANMERIASPADFGFEIVSVGRDSVVAEFVSQSRITNPPYVGVKGTKTVAEKNTEYQYVLEYDTEYSFVHTVSENDTETVYNSFFTVQRGNDIKVVFEDTIRNVISEDSTRAAGTKTEVESNDYYSSATRTFDDYDNYGTISTNSDVDWWVVSFSKGGYANFWIGNIPTGCDYELLLYADDGTTLLDSSRNSGNEAELITYPVRAGENYYVKIYSYSGSSSSQYWFRAKNYPEVIIDRHYSTYNQTASYRDVLQYRMNCYGYAIHVYSLSGTSSSGYKQQPGEFVRDGKTYYSLLEEFWNALNLSESGDELLDFVEEKIYADFATLNTYSGSEWTISPTTRTAIVPSGYRKIALTVGLEMDYHFYLRHSDGTWSHKPGSYPVTNLSFETYEVITDSNIASAVVRGGYDDGVRYYLIGKSAVIDYAHEKGDDLSTVYTSTSFLDCAGDTITKAATITGSSKAARFDYADDIDYYEFIPSSSRTYNFSTSLTSSSYDVDMVVYDETGTVIASDYAVGNPNIALSLVAGSKYYIRVREVNDSMVAYTLYCN